MASILCSKCNCGIHYHAEPQDIQYIFISQKDWTTICNSEFDRNRLPEDHTGYPHLYRTDTIEEDFRDKLIKLWKCPNCGSVTMFDNQGYKEKTFIRSDFTEPGQLINEGILFDDYSWDRITEAAAPDSKLKSQRPTFYIKVYKNGALISPESSFLTPCYYTKYMPDAPDTGKNN